MRPGSQVFHFPRPVGNNQTYGPIKTKPIRRKKRGPGVLPPSVPGLFKGLRAGGYSGSVLDRVLSRQSRLERHLPPPRSAACITLIPSAEGEALSANILAACHG